MKDWKNPKVRALSGHPRMARIDVFLRDPRNAVSYLGHIALQLATNFAED
jgi:hypothetical protein